MPRYKLIFSHPQDQIVYEKFIFATPEEVEDQIIPRYRDRMGFIIHELAEAPTVFDKQVL